jgi:hypothetical protein
MIHRAVVAVAVVVMSENMLVFETYTSQLVMDDFGSSIVLSIVASCQIGCLKLCGIV